MTEVYELLGSHPFFYGMTEEHLRTVAATATPVEMEGEVMVFREGEPADACYLILDGKVGLEIAIPPRETHVIQTLGDGDIIGWSWLFPPYRWSFDAQTMAPTKAIRFDGPELRAAKEADPFLGYDLLKRFAEVMVRRLQAARIQLLDVYANGR